MRKTDVTVREAELFLVEMPPARATLKFGASTRSSDKPSKPQRGFIPHVRVRVENGAGRSAVGWGAIPIGVAWSWPRSDASEQARSDAIVHLMREFCRLATDTNPSGHPLDVFGDLESELASLSRKACAAVGLNEDMPYLAALISLSPLDAAIHDAFGMANGIDTYDGYGPDFMPDLSRYLGSQFRGRYLGQYLQPAYKPWIPVFHLVGGADKLRRSEVDESDPQDGLPNSLDDWIEHDRLICLKVKLCGTDLEWDLERTLAVEQVAREVQSRLGIGELHLSTDMNEQAESPEYVVEFLHKLRERRPSAFDALLYVEQPTERDLNRRRLDMSPITALKPVIVDESLMTVEDFDLTLELNWTGIALKTCKCHSHALLCAAKAEEQGVPYMVQDLTNTGLSLIHSVGLAARLDTMMGVEANSRQFRPAWSEPEARVHPHTLWPVEGRVSTETFGKVGLGYRIEEIDRSVFREA